VLLWLQVMWLSSQADQRHMYCLADMFYIATSTSGQLMIRSVTSSGPFSRPLPSIIAPMQAKRVRVMNNGLLTFVLNDNSMWTKPSLPLPWYADASSAGCCVTDVAQMPNGTYISTNTSSLPSPRSAASLQGPWSGFTNPGHLHDMIALQDGTILGVGALNCLYYRAGISATWTGGDNCFMKQLAQLPNGTFLGVTTSNELMWRDALSAPWQGPIATGVTAVVPSMPAGEPGSGLQTGSKLYSPCHTGFLAGQM
jgi:hypothetical protein